MGKLDTLAGIIASDGHITKNLSTIFVINKDKEFMGEVVVPLLSYIAGKEPSKLTFVPSGFGTGKFKVYICSKDLSKQFVNKYNIPPGSKSRTIKPPQNLTLDESMDFLCGFIAGDGSVTHDRTRPKIEIWSKSKELIIWFSLVLKKAHIQSRVFEDRKRSKFLVRIGKKEEFKKFSERYEIPHPQKQLRLRAF